MATEKKQGRAIAEGKSVFHGNRFYVAGDEDDLHAAKLPASELARLTREGVISGFGASSPKGISEEDLADDPTLAAGEDDAVLEDDGEAGGAEMGETVHREGLYTNDPAQQKATGAGGSKGRSGSRGGKK